MKPKLLTLTKIAQATLKRIENQFLHLNRDKLTSYTKENFQVKLNLFLCTAAKKQI